MIEVRELIKSVTDEELLFIAKGDYENETEKHLFELKRLIFEQDCIMTKEQYWYPYEVVELRRWVLEVGHEREFVVCNSLVLLNIIEGADGSNDAESMLETLAQEYSRLNVSHKELVLSLLSDAAET